MRVSFSFFVAAFDVALVAGDRVAAQTGMVRYVTDSDTFCLTSGEHIRISGIESTETQPEQAICAREIVLSKRAAASLRGLIDRRAVTLNRVGRSYMRTVATVSVGPRDLAASLIKAGAAKP